MKLAQFPPFDANPTCTCVKCGSTNIGTTYLPNSTTCPTSKCPDQGNLPDDLTCGRCQYWWSERVLGPTK